MVLSITQYIYLIFEVLAYKDTVVIDRTLCNASITIAEASSFTISLGVAKSV